ncbi:hypothetical protein ACTHGU_07545 [Chitinophagaceae bacterium MMS25-I14]
MRHKYLLTVFIFLCCTVGVKAQNAYYDAAYLESKKNAILHKIMLTSDVQTLLANYYPGKTANDIDTPLLNQNPFFRGAFIPQGMQSMAGSFFSQAVSSVGGLDVTTLADGIGKFLAKRTKEELNIAFFDRFRILLKNYPELSTLFPATTVCLNNVMDFEYTNVLSTMREAFEKDLKSLPHDIVAVATLNPSSACLSASDTAACQNRLNLIRKFFSTNEGPAVIASLVIADGVLNSVNAADILNNVATNEIIAKDTGAAANILKLANIVSSSLRSNSPDTTWISGKQFLEMTKDTMWLQLFEGLVYQQIKNENIRIGKVVLADVINKLNAPGFTQYISGFVNNGSTVAADFNNLKNYTDTSTAQKIALVNKFIGSFKSFFLSTTNYSMISPLIPAPSGKAKLIFYTTGKAMDITQNILVRNYNAAVMSTLILIDSVLETQVNLTDKGTVSVKDPKRAQPQASPAVQRAVRDSVYNEYTVKLSFKQDLLRYGNFMANVVNAQNSDEVADAIEAVALPPGSSLIKKTTSFNVAVQAYTGFAAGHIPGEKPFVGSMGIYAPVGVSFSLGLLKDRANPADKRTCGSLSLFVSLVDVGAIVAYRFKDPDTKLADSVKIRLENIFAPGANIVYGIPGIPLSVGGGFEWQPSLTRLSSDKATLAERSGLRWQLFIAMDLPLLNIATSKR